MMRRGSGKKVGQVKCNYMVSDTLKNNQNNFNKIQTTWPNEIILRYY